MLWHQDFIDVSKHHQIANYCRDAPCTPLMGIAMMLMDFEATLPIKRRGFCLL